MSLLSLLIALAAERSLTSSWWRFQYYYDAYHQLISGNERLAKYKQSPLGCALFIMLPVLIVAMALDAVGDNLLYLLLSTLILIIGFGCTRTRASYKKYLNSAFRGEQTSADLYHQQLLQDKNLPQMGFGQALIWLNYRYYLAIMLYFVFFGAAGVVFYRLLTTVIEQENNAVTGNTDPIEEQNINAPSSVIESVAPLNDERSHAAVNPPSLASGCHCHHDVLFWLDWLPVRITSFGYMFVGHFSNALPAWLDSLFDFSKPTHTILISVAKKAEDFMVNKEDCSEEPCLLVRLAKRTVLLLLAVISILTLVGALN